MAQFVKWFNEIGLGDLAEVGGKNSSLGEMISELTNLGVKVPNGFATTAEAYRCFLRENHLTHKIDQLLANLDVDDIHELSRVGAEIRELITAAPLTPALNEQISDFYEKLVKSHGGKPNSVAIRSSATAEDLPDASFAGQQETFLNISGIENVLFAVKQVFASLFNDRAIAYRVHRGYKHEDIALSAGIQQMVRSDLAASGVMFTLDTESGLDEVVFITSSYGLGEAVVQGIVNPDEFYVSKKALKGNFAPIINRQLGSKNIMMTYTSDVRAGYSVETKDVPLIDQNKFSLSDQDMIELAKQAVIIEQHYGKHMDIEWAKDGITGEIFILQARPETVNSQLNQKVITKYQIQNKPATHLVSGRAIGQKIGSGNVSILKNIADMHKFVSGDVLVADMTDPDWEPIMAKASAIVTNRGGRTCHAAIIARELGIPAVVGCGNATNSLHNGDSVTVSCAEGDTGFIYSGLVDFNIDQINIAAMPKINCDIMMNIGNPEKAFTFQNLPNSGVGLARLEFIISHVIGIHPKALLEYDKQSRETKQLIDSRIIGYKSPKDFYVDKLAESIAMLATSFKDKPVIVRMSDFKSNEYANLIGGREYEPIEENPMLGYRGAARYIDKNFEDCFALECLAIRKVREQMGFFNVQIMIPFVRTIKQAQSVISILRKHGLERGLNDLKIIMMCEIPSNVILAEEFLEYFDGFSIGSNDLTQLTLGIDRDSGLVADDFDERDPAVMKLLETVIKVCKQKNKYIGICGQGPSDHKDFAKWLVQQGINSMSLNPDTVLQTWMFLAEK